MEAPPGSTFRPTISVWPAEPPDLPPVLVHELRRLPVASGHHRFEFTAWDPWPVAPNTVALPDDFCLRECLATDPGDLEAVFDFVSRWGRLSPYDVQHRGSFGALPGGLDWLIPLLTDTTSRDALGSIASPGAQTHAPGALHSLHVEAHHLRTLRALVRHTQYTREGHSPADAWHGEGFRVDNEEATWGFFVMTMNAALRSFAVHIRIPGSEAISDTAGTYEVAVLQLTQLIAEERELRRCANERCHRLFTRQRGRAKYDHTGHSTGVLYCSHHCAKAQSERVRRARKRSNQSAGTTASHSLGVGDAEA